MKLRNVELASQLAEMQLSIQVMLHRPTNLINPSLMGDLAQLELGLNLAKKFKLKQLDHPSPLN